MLELTNFRTADASAFNRAVLAFARVAMAILFIYSGVGKLTGFGGFSGYLSSLGVPAPAVFAAAAMVVELGAGACLAFGYLVRPAAWGLAAYCVIATCIGHPFWSGGPQADANLIHALKNLAILGGLVVVGLLDTGAEARLVQPALHRS